METTQALLKRAASGDVDAQFRVGYRMSFARDRSRRDASKAFSHWRVAAVAGHVRAQFYLGTCFDLFTLIRVRSGASSAARRRAYQLPAASAPSMAFTSAASSGFTSEG